MKKNIKTPFYPGLTQFRQKRKINLVYEILKIKMTQFPNLSKVDTGQENSTSFTTG